MTRAASLLIGLVLLASGGCARRDWVNDMLVLADMTGTWTGTMRVQGPTGATFVRAASLRLQQTGPKVIGELRWEGLASSLLASSSAPLEGLVNGEVLSFRQGELKGELLVNGDEMTGQALGPNLCPCQFQFQRKPEASPTPRP